MTERAVRLPAILPAARPRRGPWTFHQGFFARLVAFALAIALTGNGLISTVLTQRSSAALETYVTLASDNISRAATSKIESWLDQRQTDAQGFATLLSGQLGRPDLPTVLAALAPKPQSAYDLVEVTDPSGRVLAASSSALRYDVGGQDWFTAAAAGPMLGTPRLAGGDRVLWPVTAPVRTGSGELIGVVVLNVLLTGLGEVMNALQLDIRVPTTLEVVSAQRQLLYSSAMGSASTTQDMVARGALRTLVQVEPVQRALAGHTGSVRYVDGSGRQQLASYDTILPLGWAMVVEQTADDALRPVTDLRWITLWITLAVAVGAFVLAMMAARVIVRPLAALARGAEGIGRGRLDTRVKPGGSIEMRRLGGALNAMAAQLESGAARMRSVSGDMAASAAEVSTVSEGLVATTTDQSAAATETAASMEELARSAASIAETMEQVATQAEQTCEYLREMRADVDESSQRTVSLVHKVGQINGLLELINEIADQTNMLSLNAAIEAARAGEAGRGFTVVAEEVRRLAERSKTSAKDIALIISSTQSEAEATVMAMEKSAKQTHRSLELMEHVTAASHQVRTITHEQRSATDQAVEAIEQVSVGSRQVSDGARQLASAAAAQASIAEDLQHAAETGPDL
jgi:methyl-accepting chemotaxis protein